MRKSCWCGRLQPCPDHRRGKSAHRSTWRSRSEQARFRARILAAAGHQCEYIDNDERCPATTKLDAHHDADAPNGGRCYCNTHHQAVDPYARAR